MDTSVLLAQMFGLVYTVVGIGIFLDVDRYEALLDEMLKSKTFLYFGGIMSLVAGYLIVTFHNIWEKDWRVLITIIGWIAIVKGVLLLTSPKTILVHSRYWQGRMQTMSIVTIVLGVVFGYVGFFA